jgi:hypothetical protein
VKFNPFSIFVIFLLHSISVQAQRGAEGHGSNHVKTRILWAREIAMGVLASSSCESKFSVYQCETMRKKLSRGRLVWHLDPKNPLKVVLHGVEQEVTVWTTKELDAIIKVDLVKAEELGPLEAIVTMLHEAGHAVDLSDDLVTDQLVIEILKEEKELERYTYLLTQWKDDELPLKEQEAPFYHQWATETNGLLAKARNEAIAAASAGEEYAILMAGVAEVKNNTHPKYLKFLMSTISAAEGDVGLYDEEIKKVLLLRKYYSFAMEDIEAIENLAEKPSSIRGHVRKVISRTLNLGLQAPKIKEELMLLTRGLERALILLNGDSEKETAVNICVQRLLATAEEHKQAQNVTDGARVRSLRATGSKIVQILDRGQCEDEL